MRTTQRIGAAVLTGMMVAAGGCAEGGVRTVRLLGDGRGGTVQPGQLPPMVAADEAGRIAFYGNPGESIVYTAPSYTVWTPAIPVPPTVLNSPGIPEFPRNTWRR